MNPRGRYDNTNPDRMITVIGMLPLDLVPTLTQRNHWGFHFHEACFELSTLDFKVELKLLFYLCLSTPLSREGLLAWGHDYGGVANWAPDGYVPAMKFLWSQDEELTKVPDLYKTNPIQIPTLRKSIDLSARLQQDVFQSKLDPQKLSLDKNVFCRFPPEVQLRIVALLPSQDIHSLRLSSPVFAVLGLSERFWASRFDPGKEFEYIPEVTKSPPKSWRWLYLSLHIWASDNLGMANRRRLWPFVRKIQSLLCQMEETECYGTPSRSWFENEEPDDLEEFKGTVSWHTAERNVVRNWGNFVYGCTAMRSRSLRSSQVMKVKQVSISLVETLDGAFVSGLTFTNGNSASTSLGYIHPNRTVHLDFSIEQRIMGWVLALDTSGVRAIAVVAEDRSVSNFAGDPGERPLKRLTDNEGISSIMAEFDVSLFPLTTSQCFEINFT